ncbi:MAG: sensor histidine kinase [Acidobacteria bacterium]|nr:sensor histidine kinase [Acidobacteriota bacterium]
MHPHAAERRDLDRQIALARPIFLVLALVDLLELDPSVDERHALFFVTGYLAVAIFVAVLDAADRWGAINLPLPFDVLFLTVFLVLTPSLVSWWFPFLFLMFAGGIRWGMRRVTAFAGIATLALLVRSGFPPHMHWPNTITWVPLGAGTFFSGVGLGFLGARQRRQAEEHEFLERISTLLQVERGMTESVRSLLQELTGEFGCQQAWMAFRDQELQRLFVWKFVRGQKDRLVPENLPLEKCDSFLLDDPEATVCWNSMDPPSWIGWNRHDGKALTDPPLMPGPSRQEMSVRSLASTVLEFAGQPAARILLCNLDSKFYPQDLRWLERVVRHLTTPIENLFLLRHLRARTIEGERSRISRDLHDSILQTMLGLDIQLEVLRRKLPMHPEQAAEDLSALQKAISREGADLRRMMTDMRPVHVESADLVDMMYGFAERFRAESSVGLDLIADSVDLQAPDRICRELFQIYREALNNVKKHSRATHVVVKLWQDETKIYLAVDDNGQGFSFAGTFSSDELDRLRLGPISIKERARGVGGVLTVESSPGHGSRLTLEIPLN